jgi:hypothetical protein
MASFVVIGTDHRMQIREHGFEGLLRAWASTAFILPLVAIAEEYHGGLEDSTGQRLAAELGVRWYNIDMTTDERQRAGILQEQRGRPISTDEVAYRVPSDVVRESAWIERLTSPDTGTTIVICGYVHYAALVGNLRARGCAVDGRVYLDCVPQIMDFHS